MNGKEFRMMRKRMERMRVIVIVVFELLLTSALIWNGLIQLPAALGSALLSAGSILLFFNIMMGLWMVCQLFSAGRYPDRPFTTYVRYGMMALILTSAFVYLLCLI